MTEQTPATEAGRRMYAECGARAGSVSEERLRDEDWQRVERAIWPDGPAHGHGSGEYAALKARIIAALAEPAGLDVVGPLLWWCPAWGTLNATRYHGNDGPDDPNCGKVAYYRARLSEREPGGGS